MKGDGKEDVVVSEPIHPEVRIGHAHLKVADLDRATAFYRDVLGFEVMMEMGAEAAFLSAGGYHHHIGLNTWHSAGGTPPPEGHTGLFHIAILYPDRRELAKAVKRVLDHGHTFTGGQQTPAGEAVYLDDPEGNGLELYYDGPREQWTDEEGKLLVDKDLFKKLDPKDLLQELGPT
jgi:catechol 2,3-dioxygenase